jgi:ubiquinone biosynthesis protein UbiJ
MAISITACGNPKQGFSISIFDGDRYRHYKIHEDQYHTARDIALKRFETETQYNRDSNLFNTVDAIIALQKYVDFLELKIEQLEKESKKK